jgi:hypothetical protein
MIFGADYNKKLLSLYEALVVILTMSTSQITQVENEKQLAKEG